MLSYQITSPTYPLPHTHPRFIVLSGLLILRTLIPEAGPGKPVSRVWICNGPVSQVFSPSGEHLWNDYFDDKSTLKQINIFKIYLSVHSATAVLLLLHNFSRAVFIWWQSLLCPGSLSLCKRIYSLIRGYLETKSQIWPFIQPTKSFYSNIFWNWGMGWLSIWKHATVISIGVISNNVYFLYYDAIN